MDLIVLDANLNEVTVVDTYESLIWTDRYRTPGDFELYTPVTDGLLTDVKQDRYLMCRDSDHVMIVEKLLVNTDAESGNHITITGRSLESILDRRIIWGTLNVRGNLQDGVHTLLDACIIAPSDPDRKIDNFIFKASTDPRIANLTLTAQYTGDNLLSVIEKICSDNNLGFKVTLNESRQFVFELYSGTDRSYDQNENPYVVFSPEFDNIVNSNYVESKSTLKNVALIGGEGEGAERRYASVGSGVGLDRREIFTDARDISSDAGDGVVLSEAEYTASLQQRGRETLAENVSVTSFEGQVETTIMYRYGEDFFNGDIVQIMNEYGHASKVRILEIVMSDDLEGFTVYPTFATI